MTWLAPAAHTASLVLGTTEAECSRRLRNVKEATGRC